MLPTVGADAQPRPVPIEEPAIALERHAQVLGRDVGCLTPPRVERSELGGEPAREIVHHLGQQLTCTLDRVAGLVDEPGLDLVPAVLIAGGVGEQWPVDA
jgi:hypothetical protein